MIRKYLSLWLIAMLLLPNLALASELRPMGRYVEEEIQMPEESDFIIKLTSEDGQAMIATGSRTGAVITHTRDVQGWTKGGQVPSDLGFSDIDQRGEDVYILHYPEEEDDHTDRPMRFVDGQWLRMNIDLDGLIPVKIAVAADGAALLQCPDDGILAFDPETGALLQRFDGLDGAFTTHGDGFFAVSSVRRSVMQYDVATGQLIHEMKNAPITGDDLLAFDGSALYLANSGGVYRIVQGGTIWEQLVDGMLTSLRQPSISLDSMAVQDGDVYVLTFMERIPLLLRYHLDATVSTLPLHALNVYTLYKNNTLTQAAFQFQVQNPDIIVNITTLISEDTGVTADDAIRALNTELLSGKGPDVLLLDGMPMSDYIEKGVLQNLSPLVGELDSAGELMSALFEPLYRDGQIFAVPMSCALPVVLGKEENIRDGETLNEMVARIDGLEAQMPIVWRTRQGYFSMFLPAAYPAWFGADGQLDEAAFGRYLEAIDAIYTRTGVDESMPNQKAYLDGISQPFDGSDDSVNWIGLIDMPRLQDGRALFYPLTLGNFKDHMGELTILKDMGGTLAWLPGQATRAYEPRGMLGVNARSAQVDAATAFVRTALSQGVQDEHVYGGLPVNQKSISMLVDMKEHRSMSFGLSDPETGEDLGVVGTWPEQPMREKIAAMLSSASMPYLPDSTLMGMIMGELSAYFDGAMDAQAAAQAVTAKVRAYLAE